MIATSTTLISKYYISVYLSAVMALVGSYFSLCSYQILPFIPLHLVQILMFILSIAGVALLIRWRTIPGIVWTGYHGGELVLVVKTEQ